MKKVLIGIFCVGIMMITLMTGFTIHGRELRKAELHAAFYSSMENAMRMLKSETGGPQSEQEWKIMFVDSLKAQIKSASDLEVRILYADMEKGILSAEAVLYYTHPNGQDAQLAVSDTIYMEEYVETGGINNE